MSAETTTAVSDAPHELGAEQEWALAFALDCCRPSSPPARWGLAQVREVEIGRGDDRAIHRSGDKLRVDIPDRLASVRHARLLRDGDGDDASWLIQDVGSKNSTRVNGRRVEEARVGDGDTVECGATFFVLRRAEGPIADLEAPAGWTPLLRTISPTFERELAMLPRIARSRVPVLIRGESGTGKELVAEAIHALSGRGGELVPVNCGALPAALVESELFGSRRGAFSGAEDRPGLARAAEGGTLFLDEIAELATVSQTALLRFLQEGEVSTLGAGKRVVIDVRVVAATNRPVEALIAQGGFRKDLYARLRGYEVRLPSVRSRLEDLGLLCANLLARLAPDGGERTLSRAAARALFAHAWPMQVRELEQVLRSALASASSPEIGISDIRLAAADPIESPSESASAPAPPDDERSRISAALDACAGNQTRAARALGMSRTTLVHKIRFHRLARPRAR